MTKTKYWSRSHLGLGRPRLISLKTLSGGLAKKRAFITPTAYHLIILSLIIRRLGNNYTNRKKNIIKEWTKTHTPTSSGASSLGQTGNADSTGSGSARAFLANDFSYPTSSISPYASIGISVKDENSGIRDYSAYGINPYAAAAYTDLVNNPYAHHTSMLTGHNPAGIEVLATSSSCKIKPSHLISVEAIDIFL